MSAAASAASPSDSPFLRSPVLLVGTAPDALSRLAHAYALRTGGAVVPPGFPGAGPRDVSVAAPDRVPDASGPRVLSVYASAASDPPAAVAACTAATSFELAVGGDAAEEAWLLDRLSVHARRPAEAVGGAGAARTMGPHTFFLSLSFGDVEEAGEYMGAMCADTDMLEFRMDLIADQSRHHLVSQIQSLRLMARPHATRAPLLASPGSGSVLTDALPVLYTCRTAHQAGKYPDATPADIDAMYDALALGLRCGCEVLDVESAWDADPAAAARRARLLDDARDTHGSTLLLGSHHVVGRTAAPAEAAALFEKCALDGRAHGAKLVLSCEDEAGAGCAADAARVFQQTHPDVVPVHLVLGDVGQRSRMLNTFFTPVTHGALPFKAAPGQLSAQEIMESRVADGSVPAKKFCILGHNISYSVSPAMQGAALRAVGLPHTFEDAAAADVEDVEQFVTGDLFTADDFGGACVTIPHKQNILPYMDEVSDAVRAIGSMNTIVVQDTADGTRKLFGENTDWRGIRNPLARKIAATSAPRYALILGGGGTARAAAYAAQQLGLDRVYCNRTPAKAAELAATFGGAVVSSLDDAALADLDVAVVISTLPAAAGVTLPEALLARRPVVFDVNYKPYSTPLLEQAVAGGCEVVRGSEMLWEQGAAQLEIWTGRTAPYGVMRDTVLRNCLPEEEMP